MYCSGCGTENESQAQFCRECGKPLSRSQPARLIIEAEPKWFLMDAKVQIHINHTLVDTVSVKQGFTVDIPFSKPIDHIQLIFVKKIMFTRTKPIQPDGIYRLSLNYDRIWGVYKEGDFRRLSTG
jgi:hypothetical protein